MARRYDWETKVAAARAHVEDGVPLAEVMERHGIASMAPLVTWCKAYREGGPEALRPRPVGRPPRAGREAPVRSREEELAVENEFLRAKVAYLEKAAALRAERSRGATRAS